MHDKFAKSMTEDIHKTVLLRYFSDVADTFFPNALSSIPFNGREEAILVNNNENIV